MPNIITKTCSVDVESKTCSVDIEFPVISKRRAIADSPNTIDVNVRCYYDCHNICLQLHHRSDLAN